MAKQRCHTCWNLQSVCPCAQRLINEALAGTPPSLDDNLAEDRRLLNQALKDHYTNTRNDQPDRWYSERNHADTVSDGNPWQGDPFTLRWVWNGNGWRQID